MLLLSCMQYSRLSKQYGMEIYLKKEQLHYTGSVKERGVLYLLTSLTQVKQGRVREDDPFLSVRSQLECSPLSVFVQTHMY